MSRQARKGAREKETRLGLKTFFFFQLLKTNLMEETEEQDSDIITCTGVEALGTEKSAAFLSRS